VHARGGRAAVCVGGGRLAPHRGSTGGWIARASRGRGGAEAPGGRAVSICGRLGASLKFEQKWWHETACGGNVPTFHWPITSQRKLCLLRLANGGADGSKDNFCRMDLADESTFFSIGFLKSR
jgi:hypothetical protein